MGKAVNDLRKCSSKQISQLAKTLIEYDICVSIYSLLSKIFLIFYDIVGIHDDRRLWPLQCFC